MENQIFKIEELEERLEMSSAELLGADNGVCWVNEA
jgi:hypothetical protein